MDISLDAIDGWLNVAAANAGKPQETAALARAQIIATLLATNGGKSLTTEVVTNMRTERGHFAQIGLRCEVYENAHEYVYVMPKDASYQDRLELAAHVLGLPVATLEEKIDGEKDAGQYDDGVTATQLDTEDSLPLDDGDWDDDIFRDARQERDNR